MFHARCRLALSASVLFVVSGASGAEPAAPAVRVLRVKAVADEAFREKGDWEREVREHLAWSDQKLLHRHDPLTVGADQHCAGIQGHQCGFDLGTRQRKRSVCLRRPCGGVLGQGSG